MLKQIVLNIKHVVFHQSECFDHFVKPLHCKTDKYKKANAKSNIYFNVCLKYWFYMEYLPATYPV